MVVGTSVTYPLPPAQCQLMCPPLRCPLKTLQKCEIALEKLKNDMAVVSGCQGPTPVGRRLSGQGLSGLQPGDVKGRGRLHLTPSLACSGPSMH